MAETDDAPGPDQVLGAPHPREQTSLFGHAEAEADFLRAYRAGQLHHAWLVGGPAGIGKATFAYRAARFLLTHPDPGTTAAAVGLGVPRDHAIARQVAALSHPDLAVVRRGPRKDGKGFSAEIAVADVRRALDLFGSTAGGYRICIVDAADDLNASSANALLKAVEEPPPRSVIFIIAHAPARVLPTLRSRCRRLLLRPLGTNDVALAVRSLGEPWAGAADAVVSEAATLSGGSVGRALSLLDADRIALIHRVQGLLERLPELELDTLYRLAEDVSRRDSTPEFEAMRETLADWLADRIRAQAGEGARRLAPLVEAWEKNAGAAREAEALNLDRRPVVISLFCDLADAMRQPRAV
ncbi:DNA polymerase III subunit delta' [Chelatococcus reniformis]|uniref:DNA polymerase III subunit delta n=1 Tax=Chelatococcus reniformis TaxID=1494448 RepID=A0A916U162_9HYPH|nr:DNA polymerase III subunit delta' [Chelatococcus reniformis]GGC56629.1 DNA polymerase III subunit delta' [Chelatococcus reniformis]